MQQAQDFSIRYVSEGEIRSGDADLFCLVYSEAGRQLFFYGDPVRSESGALLGSEIRIPRDLSNIQEPSIRCVILERIRDFSQQYNYVWHPNVSTRALDAEIIRLKRAA